MWINITNILSIYICEDWIRIRLFLLLQIINFWSLCKPCLFFTHSAHISSVGVGLMPIFFVFNYKVNSFLKFYLLWIYLKKKINLTLIIASSCLVTPSPIKQSILSFKVLKNHLNNPLRWFWKRFRWRDILRGHWYDGESINCRIKIYISRVNT